MKKLQLNKEEVELLTRLVTNQIYETKEDIGRYQKKGAGCCGAKAGNCYHPFLEVMINTDVALKSILKKLKEGG